MAVGAGAAIPTPAKETAAPREKAKETRFRMVEEMRRRTAQR